MIGYCWIIVRGEPAVDYFFQKLQSKVCPAEEMEQLLALVVCSFADPALAGAIENLVYLGPILL